MSSLSTLPAKLSPPPSDREAINDAIYRAVTGIDSNDADLFDSAITDSARFDLNGKTMQGREAVHARMFGPVSALDTTHLVTNIRVHVGEGGSAASATASALAQHYRGGQGAESAASRYMAGVLYWVDLVKDGEDGLWRAEHWKIRTVWGRGDRGVMTGIGS